jgi:1-deoxy-D-xylulose-5-phosphate reductoisomerase
MVQYRDHSVVAQLGTPDMRVPIAYGLSWPERIESGAAPLDFHALAAMTFEAMDEPEHVQRFPGLRLAWETLRGAPGSCAILNAANEVAVEAFLNKRIRFDQIHELNRATLDSLQCSPPDGLDDLLALDARSREEAERNLTRLR